MMGVSRNYQQQLCISFAVTALLCFFSLTFQSAGDAESRRNHNNNNEDEEKMMLGSRPPGCVNRCMSCRPCEATLVIPPHKINNNMNNYYYDHHESHREDDSYYLLSWKCSCGNKLYHP